MQWLNLLSAFLGFYLFIFLLNVAAPQMRLIQCLFLLCYKDHVLCVKSKSQLLNSLTANADFYF